MKRLLLFLCILSSVSVLAQENTSDSTSINSLREYPKKNLLPVRRPILRTLPAQIPDTHLNLKVNYWRNWVIFGVTLNQAAFTNNWKGGGVNSLALAASIDYKADYTKDDFNYTSQVILEYGKIRNKGQLQKKSNDRIYWDNKLGYKLSNSWNLFASVNFQSQFDSGFTYSSNNGIETATLVSKFMAPGYLTESFGLEYKPNKEVWVRFGTGTARQTFVLDRNLYKNFPKNYGVDTGKVFRNELAFQVVGSLDKNIMPNVNLKALYSMFAGYEKLSHIDQRLDLTLTAQVNKALSVKITAVALYDDDSDTRIQGSQNMGLGLVYKFPRAL